VLGLSTFSGPLSFAVRPRVLAHYIGQLCLILAGLTVIPAGAALLLQDYSFAVYLGVTAGGLTALGYVLFRNRAPSTLQNNEAMVIAASIFLIAPLAMTPAIMSAGLSFVDALFEATSGVTTTGLSILDDVESASPSVLFLRSWMQWYGGLGFVALSLALLAPPSVAARRLSSVPGEDIELVGSTRIHSRRVVVVYSALTLIGIVILLFFGLPLSTAIIHVLSTVSTGGFSDQADSIASMTAIQQTAILAGCAACGCQ